MAPVDPANQYGSSPITPEDAMVGPMEAAVMRQVARQEADGEVDDRHAASVALALIAARKVDALGPREKAYGVAQVLNAARNVIELLPKPEKRDSATYEKIVDAIMDSDED